MAMTTERAIEVLQEYVKWFDRPVEAERGILTDEMFNVTEFGKALDKAIEVMGAYIQIGNVKPYHRTIK